MVDPKYKSWLKKYWIISQRIVYDIIQSCYDGKGTSYTRIAKGLQIGTSKVQVRIRKYKRGKKKKIILIIKET